VAAFLTARRIVITRRNQQGPQSGFSILIIWISAENRTECRINVGWVKIVVIGMLGDKSCGLL
jgi:hypothetical protein